MVHQTVDSRKKLRYTEINGKTGKEFRGMDFLGKVGDTISAKGKIAMDKAKILAEIAGLRGQIATCEEVIKKNYMEIGKLYFEEYSDVPEAPFEKQCEAIRNARKGTEELKLKIEQLKKM